MEEVVEKVVEEQAPEEVTETSPEDTSENTSSSSSSTKKETKTYTVTFKTPSGDVFCTQSVKEGKTASKPTLQPSASGSWNYDFTKAVTENIIIKWSAQ